MSFFSFLLASCCVVFSLMFSNVHCDTVVNGKTYVIRTSRDGRYLNTLGNGQLCQSLSGIVATRRGATDPFPIEYKWLIREITSRRFNFSLHADFFAKSPIPVAKNGLDRGHLLNEISLYSPPPSCYQVYRYLDLIPDAANSTYKIVNVMDGKCLSYNGRYGDPVSWQTCKGSEDQKWIFQETTPADK